MALDPAQPDTLDAPAATTPVVATCTRDCSNMRVCSGNPTPTTPSGLHMKK